MLVLFTLIKINKYQHFHNWFEYKIRDIHTLRIGILAIDGQYPNVQTKLLTNTDEPNTKINHVQESLSNAYRGLFQKKVHGKRLMQPTLFAGNDPLIHVNYMSLTLNHTIDFLNTTLKKYKNRYFIYPNIESMILDFEQGLLDCFVSPDFKNYLKKSFHIDTIGYLYDIKPIHITHSDNINVYPPKTFAHYYTMQKLEDTQLTKMRMHFFPSDDMFSKNLSGYILYPTTEYNEQNVHVYMFTHIPRSKHVLSKNIITDIQSSIELYHLKRLK